MDIQKQVCLPDQALRLKQVGVVCENSAFLYVSGWIDPGSKEGRIMLIPKEDEFNVRKRGDERSMDLMFFPAFTLMELALITKKTLEPWESPSWFQDKWKEKYEEGFAHFDPEFGADFILALIESGKVSVLYINEKLEDQ